MVRIIRESGPPRGNSVVYVTYKKLSLNAKVELLKVKILSLTVCHDDDDDDDNNNNNIL